MFTVEIHASSHIGRVRKGNEDNFLVLNIAGGKRWTGSQDDFVAVMARQVALFRPEWNALETTTPAARRALSVSVG